MKLPIHLGQPIPLKNPSCIRYLLPKALYIQTLLPHLKQTLLLLLSLLTTFCIPSLSLFTDLSIGEYENILACISSTSLHCWWSSQVQISSSINILNSHHLNIWLHCLLFLSLRITHIAPIPTFPIPPFFIFNNYQAHILYILSYPTKPYKRVHSKCINLIFCGSL